MNYLDPVISTIESLLDEGSNVSLTYAALECRLAIELICYDRLRLSHDLISHKDLGRWQPRDIVNRLIQEVNSTAAQNITVSVSKGSRPQGSAAPTLDEYRGMEFVSIGTQAGFSPKKLGALWNALSNLALHVHLPTDTKDTISRYGDNTKIREKVVEALDEIRRIAKGTLLSSGFGEIVSFECRCGVLNKRRLGLLSEGQVISCVNFDCDESYDYVKEGSLFGRRVINIDCRKCGKENAIARRRVEALRLDKPLQFCCDECGAAILIAWRLMHGQM